MDGSWTTQRGRALRRLAGCRPFGGRERPFSRSPPPFNAERLDKAIDRYRSADRAGDRQARQDKQLDHLLQSFEKHRATRRIAIKTGAHYRVLDLEEITAIVAEDHYAVIKSDKGEIICDDSLDAMLGRLPKTRFLRIHRSAIIQINKVASLDREGDRKYFALMRGNENLRLPISRQGLVAIKYALGIE